MKILVKEYYSISSFSDSIWQATMGLVSSLLGLTGY